MIFSGNQHSADDIGWFKEIFDTHYESIRRYAWYKTGNVQLADDIVQDVFLKLWQMRHSIHPDTIKSLLYTIATNIIRSHYRHVKVVYHFEKNFAAIDGVKLSADEALRMEEMQNQLERVMEGMPESAREALLMSRIENLSYEEIAQRLGISVKAVEKRISQALKILREKLNFRI